jgi:hypothetical protein
MQWCHQLCPALCPSQRPHARLQAEIDLQSGILNAEEKDYKTAYSYFFEAFEQYNNLGSPKALPSLKCMLLCKIMSDNSGDVAGIISSKSGLKHMGPDLEAMQLVAKARTQSSLEQLKVRPRSMRAAAPGPAASTGRVTKCASARVRVLVAQDGSVSESFGFNRGQRAMELCPLLKPNDFQTEQSWTTSN